MAVVSAIARLASNDMALIDAVFRQTPFYRPKWDESRGNGKTYGLKTIEKIVQSRVFITSSDSETSHVSVADVWDSVKTYRRSGGARGFHPGWDELEVYYRPTLGSLTVLVGEPSSGKSTFIDCLTLKMARKHGWKFCMASFETLPIERHINSLCQAYIGKPTYEFLEGCATDEEMDEAGEFLDKHYRFLLPSDNEMDMGSILKNVREEVIDFGVKGFVLDPFTELNMPISSGLSEVRLIEHQLRKLQQFTRVMEIHTWLLVHPTKSSENYITSDKIKRPSLYSASGAAHFRNKADFGLVIHRIEGERVNLYIDKVRYDSAGGNGMVSFVFDKNKKEYFPTLPDSDW
jgi:twinkle protein